MSARSLRQAAHGSSFQSKIWGKRLHGIFLGVRSFASKADPSLSRTSLVLDCQTIIRFREEHSGYQGERAFMHAGHFGSKICSIRWTAALSDSHVVGLFLHEFGHLKGGLPEPQANRWVEKVLGIRIEYKGPLDIQWVSPAVVSRILS